LADIKETYCSKIEEIDERASDLIERLEKIKEEYNNNIYLLKLGCHSVAVVIQHKYNHEIGLLLN
jgi:hypothetical protein